ncbi:MAG: hypothetical protein AAFO99_07975 [Bacteroidota bacterium]
MKNVKKSSLLGKLFVSIILLGLTACGEVKKEEPKDDREIVEAPEQIIDVSEARQFYDNYTKRRKPLIRHYEDSINMAHKSKDTFDVARYVYYDYKTIKQYMTFIEQEAEKADVEISTLRFYFSNYPDDEKFRDGNPVKHPRQNSIFIMPTLKKGEQDFGFFTRDVQEGKKIPVLLRADLREYGTKGIGGIQEKDTKAYATFGPVFGANPNSPMIMFDDQSLIMNEGGSAPPPHQQ